MQAGLKTRPLVTKFKTAMRKPAVAEFSRHLEQAKTTLLLAINVASFMIEYVSFGSIQEKHAKTTTENAALKSSSGSFLICVPKLK